MSYEYRDTDGDYLELKKNFDNGATIIGVTNGDEYTNIRIANEDAPRVALEILKAAGWPLKESGNTATDQIVDMLARVVYLAEKTAKEVAIEKRRDELAAEFTSTRFYSGQLSYTQKLIDRIIELESRS